MDENPNASIELYDLSTDIEEKNNIAGQHPQIVDEINKIMEEQHIFSKDFSFSYEKE